MRRARHGEVEAFNQLVGRYEHIVYDVAYKLLGCGERASAAAQEAFRTGFRTCPTQRDAPFLILILRALSDYCRHQPGRTALNPTEKRTHRGNGKDEEPAAGIQRRDVDGYILRALTSVPYDQRLALVLSDMHGFAHRDIARMTSRSVLQVRSQLDAGRRSVARFLPQSGSATDDGRARP
jgi:RNA polymerase sigma-70 factor (ECF subfamily)